MHRLTLKQKCSSKPTIRKTLLLKFVAQNLAISEIIAYIASRMYEKSYKLIIST